MTERKRLRGLKPVPDDVKPRIAGTIGQQWESLYGNTAGRRELLISLGWKWLTESGPGKGSTPTLIVETGDYFTDLARLSGLPDADAYFAESRASR
jgi:hypothetical protein